MQERRERLAGRAPVQALERTVVEHAVDPPHLLVEDGVVPDLRRELPALCGLHGDAVPGHALGLLMAVAPLALVALDLFRDCRLVASDPLGDGGERPALFT